MVKRAYKYRFYPTEQQKQELAKTFGCVRFVYNWSLDLRSTAYHENQEKIGYHENSACLTELKKNPEYSWLYDVSCVPTQQVLRHLQTAYNNFFAGRAKYPRFKKKQSRQSAEYTTSAFKWNGEKLTLARMIDPLDIRWSRSFFGKPSTVTVSKDTADRYFVSFRVEEPITPKPPIEKETGIDLGITDVVVTSDGWKSGSPRYLSKYEKRLALRQKRLSKKKKGSKNRAKARLKVAKMHAKIADCRNDFTHKLTTRLVNENQVIATETLAVKNMMRNHCLAKAISDVSWGELLRQLEYKCAWYGRTLVGIDRWFPSSKRCSCCGYVRDSLDLGTRMWECPKCNSKLDRDVNAACNILAVGNTVLACGESVSLVSSLGISRSP